ncbi:uncharacterized protein LOC134281952 isoform X3 [Saccostrea cucullata]|uniref:uncharacterized protein LOC134281952 isoform X3 n=1 Tax=Saccostrea cuccullata TaxID=36930 RepID=UPI002ED2B227
MAGTSGPEMPEDKADEDEAVTQFLMSIGLDCLTELFSKQKITMDILKEMTSENLKEAGVQEYGYRHKIIKELNKRKGTSASVQRSIYQRKRKAIFEQHNMIPSKKHCKLDDNDDAITEDENRFLRFLLLAQLGTEAMRMAFDNTVPPPHLASHLQTHIRKLKERCTSQQMKVLFPTYLVSTTNFDTTLLYTLFRNTVSVKAPSNGWGKDPRPHSTSLTDDIERVRIHRNSICHGKTSMDQLTFQRKWFDLSEAISRLSNGKLKKETSSLETRNFDKKARKSIMDDFDLLQNRVSELEQTHIPAHIKERQTEEIKVWEEDDEVFCETRAFNEFEEMMNIHNIVTIIGGPGTGKTAKARHLAIKYKSEGWEIIPVICLEDIKNFGHFSVKQLFLYDDPAGVFGFDRSRYNSLVDFTKIIKSLSEK